MITVEQLHRAVTLVHTAVGDLALEGRLSQEAFSWIDQWLQRLPLHRATPQDLALSIAFFLDRPPVNGAAIDGALVDSEGRASMEALILHYEDLSPNLFPMPTVASARARLESQGGPRYTGPWP